MQRRYLNELDEGGAVQGSFVLRSKELRAARTGDAYLTIELADRTAALGAVYFRPPRVATEIPVGSIVEVRGVVSTYRGSRRVTIEVMEPAAQWDPADLMASSPRSYEEMVQELRDLIRTVETAPYRRLLRAFFADGRFRSAFEQCPAAQSMHHAYLGGLLEHSLSVAAHCVRAAEAHRTANRDLLVTAAVLHDIGRIEELSYHTGISHTQAGRLIGHVVLGAQMVHARGLSAGIEPAGLEMLEHIILSHHSERDGESAKRPSTIEALILQHVDNLDASVAGFEQALSGATTVGEGWTDSDNVFGRPLYAPRSGDDHRDPTQRGAERRLQLTA